MKGINLKKIGAIVAGATILASSVAFAGLMYENKELVDANGQPVAKVVLGSNAQASDGAVAGAIAAKLASVAYAKKTLTAAVANDATCTTSGATGNGTCAISNEKVTLEVTVPGASNSGIHAFVTDIGDFIDRQPENRENTLADDLFELTESETDTDANPFSDGLGGSIGLGDEDIYRISGTDYSPFATKTVSDPNTGDTYTEYQRAYIKGVTEYVDADKAIESTPSLFLYQVKFDEAKHFGIPVCTSDEDSDGSWADCASGDPEYTGKHRVKIQFLGSEWIITEMTPAGTTTSTDEVVAGGTVKLAKESVYGIVNVGEKLTSKDGQLQIRLDDISTQVGFTNVHPAIITFLDANGNVLSQDQIDPGSTIKKTIGGKTYRVRVYQTAPGYTFGAKWAEMAMLESELELKDDDTLQSDKDVNDDWTVRVLWKNKDASVAQDDVDHWRGVLLYRNSFGDSLVSGNSVNMAEDPVAYKLTYKGLDLTSSDYDPFKVATATTTSLTFVDGTTCTLASTEYLKMTSGVDDGFQYTGTIQYGDTGTGTGKGKEVFYLLASQCSGNLDAGDIIMKKSGSNPARYLGFDTDGDAPEIKYKTAGSRATDTEGGVVLFVNSGVSGQGSDDSPEVWLYEDIGTAYDSGPTEFSHAVSEMGFYYDYADSKFYDTATGDDNSVEFVLGDSYTFDGQVGYTDGNSYEAGFISPRGTKFKSMSSSAVQFDVAKRVGKAKYEFATVTSANQSATATQLTLSEGQTGQVGDVTIKVLSIDETVGACAATGGSATCTVPKDQLSAVIMPDNAASVSAITPYAGFTPKLVVLDKDAAAVSTGVLITVGGDAVNTVTKDAMSGAGIDFTATPVVTKVVGNKIIVAGLTAADTIAAGDKFLADVKVQ